MASTAPTGTRRQDKYDNDDSQGAERSRGRQWNVGLSASVGFPSSRASQQPGPITSRSFHVVVVVVSQGPGPPHSLLLLPTAISKFFEVPFHLPSPTNQPPQCASHVPNRQLCVRRAQKKSRLPSAARPESPADTREFSIESPCIASGRDFPRSSYDTNLRFPGSPPIVAADVLLAFAAAISLHVGLVLALFPFANLGSSLVFLDLDLNLDLDLILNLGSLARSSTPP
ncbi:hypothetical protein CH63R_01368 [Colletotrichum higginsianum IMI 349063]|uniref:Uncharacterized protein n=1 Tax=Colletotrichum higginsianum (strain IMI 349063) TaxID=759273 RepID=A0A1B7YWD9_COLHI|nr:hypothetical protein CH63R_01368 [Colletotrichum higginsianum IMI 349063]OBR16188.1 hypothetical protein CH63R_01368 [Colletotrichum higginsianum IMI 349063]